MGRTSFRDFGQVLQVGFPSAPAASGSFCNSELLLPTDSTQGPTALTASPSGGSRAMNVSHLTDSGFKHRQMKVGQDTVGTQD